MSHTSPCSPAFYTYFSLNKVDFLQVILVRLAIFCRLVCLDSILFTNDSLPNYMIQNLLFFLSVLVKDSNILGFNYYFKWNENHFEDNITFLGGCF